MSGKIRNYVMPEWDGDKLRDWREIYDIRAEEMAQRLEVSLPSHYRYEGGFPPPVDVATKIASITNGHIRYRDMWPGFLARYA